MLIFSWILRHGQVLGSWEWGVGSQGRAEVTGGRDSRVREAHWGAGKQASLPAAQEMCTRAPPGGGGGGVHIPPQPFLRSGGRRAPFWLSDHRSPGSGEHAVRWGLCCFIPPFPPAVILVVSWPLFPSSVRTGRGSLPLHPVS